MQAISIAIGKNGIQYFTQQLVAGNAVARLQELKPPDNTIDVPSFSDGGMGSGSYYSNVHVYLTQGSMTKFIPVYQSVVQGNGGDPVGNSFTLTLSATNFTAKYDWKETYHEQYNYHCGQDVCTTDRDCSKSYTYMIGFGSMAVTLNLNFNHDSANNTYTIKVATPTPAPATSNVSPNIPSRSIINSQVSDGCFSRKVEDATKASVGNIDFATPINELFSSVLQSIPDSGRLGHNIAFDFALGDSGLAFPTNASGNHDGLTIGVKGVASYKGTAYSGGRPPSLPVPAVPADDEPHHLNVYVSDWAINGLNWAYFKAGLLDLELMPSDIPNPNAMKTQFYANYIPQFKQYGNRSMKARITPLAEPVTTFQTVYLFTATVMEALKKQLPDSVYQNVSGLDGTGFTSQADIETALAGNDVPQPYYATIEAAAKAAGMVTSQTMEFMLIVQYPEMNNPNIIFDVTRADIMTDLGLGVSRDSQLAQTMQFSFLNASNRATFKSTTIDGFDQESFGDWVWPVVGESQYAEAMKMLGQTGVAIPIMEGFQFLFSNAVLSIQRGYVSIGAQVEFKPSRLSAATAAKIMTLVKDHPDLPAHPVPLLATVA